MSAIAVPEAPPAIASAAPRRRRSERMLLEALLGAALMLGLHQFAVQVSVVRGKSMEPALHDGDRLVVDRVAYAIASVARGDVVVLRYPRNPAIDFVKRVIGVPGDRVAMQAGIVYVNGAAVDDRDCIPDHENLPEVVVPPEHFFVLGDNRPISCDSRDFGLVAARLLKGRVRARFWPLHTAAVF